MAQNGILVAHVRMGVKLPAAAAFKCIVEFYSTALFFSATWRRHRRMQS